VKTLRRALVVALGIALTLALALAGIPYVSLIAQLTLGAAAVVLGLWLVWKGYRAYLWKVSRRLAFSYFLIGMLPIPIVLLLLGVGSYILSGFFLGHLYRDAEMDLQADLGRGAEEQLDGAQTSRLADVSFAFYRNGRKTSGAAAAPAQWPAWAGRTGDTAPPRQPRFF